MRVIVVLASESFRDGDRAAQAAAYAEQLRPYCWQIGNEPDLRSPASWTLTPVEYAALAQDCAGGIRGVQPAALLISAGLAGRDARWLARCGPLPLDGVAVHPYGQRPEWTWLPPPWRVGTVDRWLERYRRYGKPLWITEFGTNDGRIQADYVPALYRKLAVRSDVGAACVFCYSDAMVPGFGLVDQRGRPKPVYERLAALAWQDE